MMLSFDVDNPKDVEPQVSLVKRVLFAKYPTIIVPLLQCLIIKLPGITRQVLDKPSSNAENLNNPSTV